MGRRGDGCHLEASLAGNLRRSLADAIIAAAS